MVPANMNMVRVWGGGWYEQDVFYDTCDELGILVWQDFMMACALYPDTKEFLGELTPEARYQVRRLQSHACLALWCGDNEGAEASGAGGRTSPTQGTEAALQQDAQRAKKGVRDRRPHAPVLALEPLQRRVGRRPRPIPTAATSTIGRSGTAASRFTTTSRSSRASFPSSGFSLFPSRARCARSSRADQRNPSSRVMEHHQRSPDGNLLITHTMAREMPIPSDFDSFCWVSQINQAMAIRTAVEHWRRLKPWCMGALFWQLNDLWPVASWSSIDYHGRWKVLQHEAARFFAPLLVSLVREEKALSVWATSDIEQRSRTHGELDVSPGPAERSPACLSPASRGKREPAHRRSPDREVLARKAEPHEVCCLCGIAGEGHRAENHATLVTVEVGHASQAEPSCDLARAPERARARGHDERRHAFFPCRASRARGALSRAIGRCSGRGAPTPCRLGAPRRAREPERPICAKHRALFAS